MYHEPRAWYSVDHLGVLVQVHTVPRVHNQPHSFCTFRILRKLAKGSLLLSILSICSPFTCPRHITKYPTSENLQTWRNCEDGKNFSKKLYIKLPSSSIWGTEETQLCCSLDDVKPEVTQSCGFTLKTILAPSNINFTGFINTCRAFEILPSGIHCFLQTK